MDANYDYETGLFAVPPREREDAEFVLQGLLNALENVESEDDLVIRSEDGWGDVYCLNELQVAAAIFLGRTDLLTGTYVETKKCGFSINRKKKVEITLLDLAVRFGHRGFAKELARMGVPYGSHDLEEGLHKNTTQEAKVAVEALLQAESASDEMKHTVSSMSVSQWQQIAPETLPEGSQWLPLQIKNPVLFNNYPHLQSPKAYKKNMWFTANKFQQLLTENSVPFSICKCCNVPVSTDLQTHISSLSHFDKLCGHLQTDYEAAHRGLWQHFDVEGGGVLRFNHADGKIQTEL